MLYRCAYDKSSFAGSLLVLATRSPAALRRLPSLPPRLRVVGLTEALIYITGDHHDDFPQLIHLHHSPVLFLVGSPFYFPINNNKQYIMYQKAFIERKPPLGRLL